MTRYAQLLALLVATAGLAACGDEVMSCLRASDCLADEVCVDGRCSELSARCAADVDCQNGNPCDGAEMCAAGACMRATPLDDGTPCDADDDPSTNDFCSADLCVPSRCGDGVVDAAAGEICDDGNGTNGDGCDACRYSCEEDAACDDAEECNGVESCDVEAHQCVAGTPLTEGDDCLGAVGLCMGGVCLPKSCTSPDECDDGNVCTGMADCSSGVCAAGERLDCADASACTADQCNPATGCSNRLIDEDFDGYAPQALGACGEDCDDADAAINPASADGCDGVDNDCDGSIDEEEIVTYFADCDGDGYATIDAASVSACAVPSPALAGCTDGGMWTTRAPTEMAMADCNDENASVNPAQTFQTTPIEGAADEVDFDYNCDGVEEYERTAITTCSSAALCGPVDSGYVDMVPPCGEATTWMACRRIFASCRNLPTAYTAACR